MKRNPWRRPDRVGIYPAADGFRWHRLAPNGRIVAESGEAYSRRPDALYAAVRNNPGCTVEVQR